MIPKQVTVNGLVLEFPEYKQGDVILFADKPTREQKWERQLVPDHFEDGWHEAPNEEQIGFIMRELDRILHGVWISINGEVMWISGINYFYLNYWVLDTGEHPSFRVSDVRFFWWWHICESNPRCLGTIFTKFRRQGASSRGACIAVYISITESNVSCGIVSKTGDDAKEIFTSMVVNGFKGLEDFLKPQSSGTDKAVKELIIAKQSERMSKNKKIVSKQGGLNNKVDWRPTALNSYDGKRLRYLFLDEQGKAKDNPADKYWSIVRRCLVEGVRRRGMAYVPSTVNEMDKGGDAFKKVWNASNHLVQDFDGSTASGLFKYFQPAYDGFEGYIGEYGESIIDTPTPEQVVWLKEIGCPEPTIGAREYQLKERAKLQAIGDEDALSEYIRQFPHNEREAFYKKANDSHFNPMHINMQLEQIDSIGRVPRRVNFIRNTTTDKVEMVDAHDGRWWVIWDFPEPGLSNKCAMRRGSLEPLNIREFAMGCDPFAHSEVAYGKGSMGAAFVHRKYNPLDPNNSDMPIAMYHARPKRKETMFQDWALAAEYYGCKIGVEQVNDEYYGWFTENRLDSFLIWTPDALSRGTNNKLKKKTPGIPATGVKAIEYHLTIMVEYMLHNHNKIWFEALLKDMIEFDVEDRTKYDLTMAFGYSLITAKDMDVRQVAPESNDAAIIRTYRHSGGSRF